MARRHDQPLNLDSFLDLLSNTVGALLLILILTVVMGGSVCVQPVEPTQRTLRYFVSQGNRMAELPVARLEQGAIDADWALERRGDCSVFRPRRPGIGETVDDLRGYQSRVRATITALAPETEAIFVMTFADSFEVFRALRQIAREKQVPLGWWPVLDEVKLCTVGVEPSVPKPGG